MKTHTFSVVVGTGLCNYNCPYCVSKMTCRATQDHTVNWDRFEIACRIVEQARDGLVNVILTGTGEPTLYPNDITAHLTALEKRFPLVTLQTNGSLLTKAQLERWKTLGLTQVCISVASYIPALSNRIMQSPAQGRDFWDCARMIHDVGLSVRLNCTMLREGVYLWEHVQKFIERCKTEGTEQLTLREVDRPENSAASPEVARYVDHQKPLGAAKHLFQDLLSHGANQLLELPHGGAIFDYQGQNVCISNCLTSTLDQENIRQIIFFPNGEIGYDWKYRGARIL